MQTEMKLSVDEVTLLLGQRYLEIHALNKQVAALQRQVEELTAKLEEKKD